MTQDEIIELAMQGHSSTRDAIRWAMHQALAETEKDEPVARVTGVHGGRFVVEPLNPAMVLPVNMALYANQQPVAETEKNEPVAWITNYGKGWLRWHRESDRALNKTSIPLYTRPQPRAWVGLTDEEVEDIHCTPPRERPRGKFPFARMIEAKLKGKNT